MTALDPNGHLEIHTVSDDHVRVRMALSVSSSSWMPEFMTLAQAREIPAEVHGVLLTVNVPVTASREETAELLDQALRLVDDAQAQASSRLSAVATTKQYIEDWWETRK